MTNLQILTVNHGPGRPAENGKTVRAGQLADQVHGTGMQPVSGQDRHRHPVFIAHRFTAATSSGVVDDVIMDQGRHVQIFKGGGQEIQLFIFTAADRG